MYRRGMDPIILFKIKEILELIEFASNKGNNDKVSRNAEIVIEILKNVELLNENNNLSRHSYYNNNISNANLFNKIKFFLKSLND